MRRLLRSVAIALWLAAPAGAAGQDLTGQDLAGLARLDPGASGVAAEGAGLRLDLRLSQPVPWRLFTLDAPPRLVLDFRELDFAGAEAAALLPEGLAPGLRFGAFRPGWSRLVLDLPGPLAVEEAGMAVDEGDGTAHLAVRLVPTDAALFVAAAGAPPEAGWAPPAPAPAPPRDPAAPLPSEDGRFVVAIDPGHGGVDPGAERAGLRESHLMLALGLELAEAAARAGIEPVLTRREDVFVSLSERISLARAGAADVLVSLHADALELDQARGASVYTLTLEAMDEASERMVERHGQGDLLAGLDLTGQDDMVATILMDLARADTAPASRRLAAALAEGLAAAGAELNSRPLREARFAVLKAADIPSVLLEAGFLSDETDRARLASAAGRAPIVRGLVAALLAWEAEEAALRPLRLR